MRGNKPHLLCLFYACISYEYIHKCYFACMLNHECGSYTMFSLRSEDLGDFAIQLVLSFSTAFRLHAVDLSCENLMRQQMSDRVL